MPDRRRLKCIVILSTKCSGSSALQRRLSALPGIHHIKKTRHSENETLYWTKAASVLELPQVKLPKSDVPYSKERAREGIIELLEDNVPGYAPPNDDTDLVFGGWAQLCEKYRPVLLEKSPHHLHQWSALTLMLECQAKYPEIEFLFVGLVRNPMAVFYSMWTQWRIMPQVAEKHYQIAYQNLVNLKTLLHEKLVVVRYEDMIENDAALKSIVSFADLDAQVPVDSRSFQARPVEKWKSNQFFGFQLSEETISLMQNFGYQKEDFSNSGKHFWPIYKHVAGGFRGGVRKMLPRKIRSSLKKIFGK